MLFGHSALLSNVVVQCRGTSNMPPSPALSMLASKDGIERVTYFSEETGF